ncbi:hypothetical protein [Cellvibrio sp.]|uniref:hypothetical protein n=1 Tax=Cellvibrio sp. TaxID=1965322 RepID=UPI0039647BC6
MQTKTTFTLLSASFLSLVLSACGGGEGTSTLDNFNNSSSIGSGGNTTLKIGSGSGTNFVSGAIASTASAPTLFEGDKTQLSVTVVDGQNVPTASKLKVKFDSPCLAANLSSIAGDSTVETINGTATVQYTVGKCDIDDKVTASMVVGSSTLDAFVTLPINTRRIGSGTGSTFVKDKLEVGIGDNTLSAGGTTSIAAYIVNSAGELVSDTMEVTFSSPCLSANNATITGGNTVNTVNGKAEVSYVSKGCAGVGGADLVKATTTFRGAVLTATANVFVKLDTVQTIAFADASPKQISLKGTGGLETSTVRFRVLGQAGSPVKGVCVSFEPSTTVGGLTLVEGKCGVSSPTAFNALTDADGYASTTVQAGTVPTPVRITASVGEVKTQSSVLVVTTGIPDQNSASLSLSDLAPNSWTKDGVTSTATIRLADAFNNPVPDGTAVTFTTSGGAIEGSCTTSAGTCPVEWRSQNPRPVPAGTVSFSNITETSYTMACSDGSKECRKGRVQILATAVGNESFIDGNSNGVYDDISKDIFVNSNGIYSAANKGLPISNTALCSPNAPRSSAAYGTANSCDDLREAYVDKNFNLDRDLIEEFLDFNQNGSFDPLPNGKYDGALCSGTAKANGDCTTNKVNVRQEATLVMSCGESPMVVGLSSFTIAAGETKRIPVLVADCNGNAMPKGTSVTAVTTDLVDATASLNISGGLPMSTNPSVIVLIVKADAVKTPKGATGIQVGVAGGGSVSFTVNVN